MDYLASMPQKLNLSQVAKHLGVSIATVSNAFNRPDQLSAKLRERILSESAELGYHGPNLAARSLRMGASGVVGVMLADSLSYSFTDPVASQLLQGIAEVLVQNHKQLLGFDMRTQPSNILLTIASLKPLSYPIAEHVASGGLVGMPLG